MVTITTFTGREVNPLDLHPEDVCIEDIAHALAQVNRFAGHARWPISVAQHSVLVSLLCEGSSQELGGLLHDASEAYLGDVTKWLKESPEMTAYREAEKKAEKAIFAAFRAPLGTFTEEAWLPMNSAGSTIAWADRLAVRYEFELAFGRGQKVENYGKLSRGEYRNIQDVTTQWPHLWRSYMTWQEAEAAFLMRFTDLKR